MLLRHKISPVSIINIGFVQQFLYQQLNRHGHPDIAAGIFFNAVRTHAQLFSQQFLIAMSQSGYLLPKLYNLMTLHRNSSKV
jgi:hypothetical protein